ncbi:unnamed protein product [Ambrosiozyma monospora]|uniref:Unnamed protein product n=1 Tax=Ambrosiozyma monospora TaxID=43982 RepID=A0ACB5U7G0_AMBMO|nr:unnamed protein product [Ambrosiozyma monospora]
MNCGGDRFKIIKGLSAAHEMEQKEFYEDPDAAIKDLVLCSPGELPDRQMTPYFSMKGFFDNLQELWQNQDHSSSSDILQFGANFIYGEVLTSTSTLMDANPKLLKNLPDGFTITGTTQVSGRGRSGNVWVNPPGVLAVSTLMKLPLKNQDIHPVSFVQYIATIAYIQAILTYGPGYENIPVRIKWPNDIYIMLPQYLGQVIPSNSTETTYAKIGGILVNTNIVNKEFNLIGYQIAEG